MPGWRMPHYSGSNDGRTELEELAGLRGHGSGPQLAARGGGHVSAFHLARSEQPGRDVHCHFGGRRVSD